MRTCSYSQCHRPFGPKTSRQRFCRSTCRDRKLGRERRVKRGTTVGRGYDASHKRERERWKPLVESGQVKCWRCRQWIQPGTHWQLGHDDRDRTIWRGPEHRHCNLSAAAKLGNAGRVTGPVFSSRPRIV